MMLSSTLHSRPSQGLLRLITVFLFTLFTPTWSFLQALVHFQPRCHHGNTFVYSPPVSTLFLSLTSTTFSTWSSSPSAMLFSSTWLLFSFSALEVEAIIPPGAGGGPPGPFIDTSAPPPLTGSGGKITSTRIQPSSSLGPPDVNPPPLSTTRAMNPVGPHPSGSTPGSTGSTAGVLAPSIPTPVQTTDVPNPSPNPGNPISDSSSGGSAPSKTSVKTILVSVASAVTLVTLILVVVIIRRRRQQAEHWREQEQRLQEELQREKPRLKRVSTFKEAYGTYHNKNQKRTGPLLLQGGMNSSSTSADTRKSTSKDPKQPLEEFWNP